MVLQIGVQVSVSSIFGIPPTLHSQQRQQRWHAVPAVVLYTARLPQPLLPITPVSQPRICLRILMRVPETPCVHNHQVGAVSLSARRGHFVSSAIEERYVGSAHAP